MVRDDLHARVMEQGADDAAPDDATLSMLVGEAYVMLFGLGLAWRALCLWSLVAAKYFDGRCCPSPRALDVLRRRLYTLFGFCRIDASLDPDAAMAQPITLPSGARDGASPTLLAAKRTERAEWAGETIEMEVRNTCSGPFTWGRQTSRNKRRQKKALLSGVGGGGSSVEGGGVSGRSSAGLSVHSARSEGAAHTPKSAINASL